MVVDVSVDCLELVVVETLILVLIGVGDACVGTESSDESS